MPPKPHLPPLPHPREWSKHFPRTWLRLTPDANTRKFDGRILVASRALCDEFVTALGIRPGEVVVDCNPGVGNLTRSLLSGGRSDEAAEWAAYAGSRSQPEEVLGLQALDKGRRRRTSVEESDRTVWPSWGHPASSVAGPSRSSAAGNSLSELSGTKQPVTPVNTPAVVVASEPSLPLLVQGFAYPPTTSTHQALQPLDFVCPPLNLVQSSHEPRLLLSHSSTYRWLVLPSLLADPLVAPFMNIVDPDQPPGSSVTSREWTDDAPHLTVVAQIPDSTVGEQMVAQWIGSCVEGEEGVRNWVWKWGRVRMALLCGKGLYDRIMARPGDVGNCKLSVMASALFHRSALPPYHHIPNVDKSGKTSKAAAPKSRSSPRPSNTDQTSGINAVAVSTSSAYPAWMERRTPTFPLDFFPPPMTVSVPPGTPLARPRLLGLMLMPRVHSPILPAQKEAWDYVLRNCFITKDNSISDAIRNLGFGAETLVPRFTDGLEAYRAAQASPGPISSDHGGGEGEGEGAVAPWNARFRGVPVDPGRKVRQMTVPEWARVVDVFDKWAFRPDTLMLDGSAGVYKGTREMGQD